MMQVLWAAWGKCKAWALLAVGAAAALTAIWLGGRKSAQTAVKTKELRDYQDTRKRIDEVSVDDDPAVLRDWLRERGKPDGNL